MTATPCWVIDSQEPDPQVLAEAGRWLRAGKLVAFPTETVYGLGANARDADAVARIFQAKGRPASNPVIVHVASVAEARNLARDWPPQAEALAQTFWPGPLTLVVPKHPDVPAIITAGGGTVALRCPAHPVARGLVQAAGCPVAAPSANRSTELSPTRAEHVLKGLSGRIDLVLDGGQCPAGIESTVVDATTLPVRILRPGPISAAQLAAVVGNTQEFTESAAEAGPARSPGQMAKHYSPRTPVRLVEAIDFTDDVLEASEAGKRIGMVAIHGPQAMPTDPAAYAATLYARLHDLDAQGLDVILIEAPPRTPEWAAVWDRLTRAASPG